MEKTNNSVQENNTESDVIVTPWDVKGKLSANQYSKLIEKFGVDPMTSDLLERFQKITGKDLHPLLKRGMCFAHRGFNEILDDHVKGNKFFLYTGRGPTSESLHLGHIVPIEFTAWLQNIFDVPVIIQMADDEKYWFKNLEFEKIYNLGFENAKDIIAFGFKPEKTFIFSNRDYSRDPAYQKVAFDIMKHININTVQSIFGITGSSCVGQLMWPIYQSTAAFSQAFEKLFKGNKMKCLVTYAVDQDPYFRLCRDVAPILGYMKPSSLICQFLPSLEGDSKMSSTITNTNGPVKTIFMTDTSNDIKDKINKYAFSGGQETLELHRKLGGNINVDISYQWLRYFMNDDKMLEDIGKKYSSGEMTTGELKKITIKTITSVVEKHKKDREKITNDIVKAFYDVKVLC